MPFVPNPSVVPVKDMICSYRGQSLSSNTNLLGSEPPSNTLPDPVHNDCDLDEDIEEGHESQPVNEEKDAYSLWREIRSKNLD